MARLFIIIISMCVIGYVAQHDNRGGNNPFVIMDIVIYSLFVGLRTGYNDTANYIKSYENADSLKEFMADPNRMNVLHNPLFYGINAKFHEITPNYHIFFMVVAIFNAILLIRFIKKHSYGPFSYSILLFWGFGLGMFGAAAMKQITAMAILTLAYDDLLNKKWVRFVFIVLIASLIHTYAILFLVLPFLTSKPGNWQTVLLILLTAGILLTFNSTISTALDYADVAGKSVADFEVFDGVQMNPFRVAVFGICPILLLLFRRRLFQGNESTREDLYLLGNMSIVAFMFVLMGSINGANMFGRLATYFVLGDICLLGYILKEVFTEKSAQLLTILSAILFLVFIAYDNKGIDLYGGYTAISILEFLRSVF